MTLLVIGLLIWVLAHFMRRLAPEMRTRLTDRFGDRSKGLFAISILVSIALMVVGFRSANGAVFWDRSAVTTGINNLMVLAAFYCFASAGAKTWLVRLTRHPQLIGFSLWAAAHLLVNGDTASIVLFGGLLLWALCAMALITAQEGVYDPPAKAPARKEVTTAIMTLVVFSGVAGIHMLLGYFPFGV